MKRIVAIAAALWALTATAAHADPISSAIVAVIGLTGTAAAIATTAFTVVFTAAASWATNKLFGPKKPKATVAEKQADVLSLTIGEAPRRAIFGLIPVGGYLIDAYNWGPDYEQEALVIGLCDHDIEELIGYYIGDTFYAWPGNGYQTGFQDTASFGHTVETLEIQLLRGGDPSGTFALPGVIVSTAPDRWGATDRLTGVTAVWVSYHISEQVWKTGRPQFKWVVKGAKLYDPRKDSSVPGGSGSHRWGNLQTYEWSDNAEVCRYNHERGIWTLDGAGGTQLMVGPGKSATEAPPEAIFARANLCDEVLTLKSGGTETRYRVECEVRADEPWIDVQNKFADAMAGDLVRRSGAIAVTGCAAEAISATFTDDDLVIGEQKRVRTKTPRDQLVNSVIAKFVDPAQLWQEGSAPIRRSAADISADGEERPATIDLPFVTSQSQAQRIAEINRRMARLMTIASVTLGPAFMALEEGDWVEWTSARHFGGATKTFRCEGVSHGGDMRTALALREIATAVYSWDFTTDELDALNPAYLAPGAPPALDLDGINVTTASETAVDGAPRAAIYVTWTPPLDLGLRGVIAEVRLAGDTVVQRTSFIGSQLLNPPGGKLNAELQFETDYEVRLIPVADPGRDVLESSWRPITTPVLILGPVTGLIATPTPAGATLEWDQHARTDVVGYDIRYSTDPSTAWAEAIVVDARWGATSIFAPITTAQAVTFFVRAVDRNGRQSVVSANVTTQVTQPGDVASFQAYPNGELIRLTWSAVDGAQDYELHSGLDWSSGVLVERLVGTAGTVTWPMRRDTDELFWLKARSAAGLYSVNATLSVARQPAPPERNEIVTRDFLDEGWTGNKFDLTTLGPDFILELDEIAPGVLAPFGDYYDAIELPDEFYARTWILTRANALIGDDVAWEDDTTWWEGDSDPWAPVLDDPGQARLDAYISTDADLADTLVAAWRFQGNGVALTGGVDASPFLNVSYGAARLAQGVQLDTGGIVVLPKSVPATCSFIMEFRPTATAAADCVLAAFINGAHWLQLWFDVSAGKIVLTDDLGNEASVSLTIDDDDPMVLAFWQSGGNRGLVAASRKRPTVLTDSVAAAAQSWTKFALGNEALGDALTWDDLGGATWDDLDGATWDGLLAPAGPARAAAVGRFAEVEVHDSAAPAVALSADYFLKSATGFAPFRPLYAGDYRFTDALIWLRLTAPVQAGQALAIASGTVNVDVPDVLDGEDNVTVGTGGLDITFARTFSITPAIVANQRGGGSRAHVEITLPTKTGFHIRLISASDGTTAVAGTIAWAAKGY